MKSDVSKRVALVLTTVCIVILSFSSNTKAIGRPTYTRQTFSGSRYEIWAMQSAYHHLPTINGVMQAEGRQHAARDVTYESGEDFAQLKMNIAPAYTSEAGINSWFRTVRLNRGQDVQVIDSFDLKTPSRDIVQSLITPCQIAQPQAGQLILKDIKEPVMMTVRYDPAALSLHIETIKLDDESLSEIWGPQIHRLLLTPKTEIAKDTWTLRFSITKPETSSGL